MACMASGIHQGATAPADWEHDSIVGGGPWHYHSVPCIDGVVDKVTPRLADADQHIFTPSDFERSGVAVEIKLSRKFDFLPNNPRTRAGVVHYQGDHDNQIMEAERPGDHVQVCLRSFPTPSIDPTTGRIQCNPDKDPRGWRFRVYDYRQHAAYYGSESEHYCGGA